MAKIRITLEIDARPFTQEEAEEEAKMTSLPVDEFLDGEVDAYGIGECIAGYLDGGCEEALAGSNIMVKLGVVSLIDAIEQAEVS
jgi:hypothetical protein